MYQSQMYTTQTGPHTLTVYFNNGPYLIVVVSDQWTVIRVVCIMNVVGRTDAVGIN
jgi:hypothetical protein